MPQPRSDTMPLLDHIRELRKRIIRALVVWIVITLLLSLSGDLIFNWLISPLDEALQLIVLSPIEAPILYFKMALGLGFGLTIPYLLLEMYGFAAPGLHPHERQALKLAVPGALALFLLGVLFSLYVLIPLSMPMLTGFLGNIATPIYSLAEYIGFVTTLMVWMGLLFETPLFIYVLARLGFVTPPQLRKSRRVVIFSAAVIAAVVTPTHDPITMMIVTGPFILLYELGILLSGVAARQRKT